MQADQLAHYQKRGVGPERFGEGFLARAIACEMMIGTSIQSGWSLRASRSTYPKTSGFSCCQNTGVGAIDPREVANGLPEQGAYTVCLDTGWGVNFSGEGESQQQG